MRLARLFLLAALGLPVSAWAQSNAPDPAGMPGADARTLQEPDEEGDSFAPVDKEPIPFSQPSAMPPGAPEPQPPSVPVPAQPENAPAAADGAKPAPVPDETLGGDSDFERVTLQGLNKVTARAETIDAPIGSAVRLGTIEIVAHRCWKSAPDKRPENAALLEISEIKQGETPSRIFLGWMFSSSPALSALEHPFYDVTVVACEKPKAEPKKAEPPPTSAKKPKTRSKSDAIP